VQVKVWRRPSLSLELTSRAPAQDGDQRWERGLHLNPWFGGGGPQDELPIERDSPNVGAESQLCQKNGNMTV
jgi:hypothetical protein